MELHNAVQRCNQLAIVKVNSRDRSCDRGGERDRFIGFQGADGFYFSESGSVAAALTNTGTAAGAAKMPSGKLYRERARTIALKCMRRSLIATRVLAGFPADRLLNKWLYSDWEI
jgi:hypothetical protein